MRARESRAALFQWEPMAVNFSLIPHDALSSMHRQKSVTPSCPRSGHASSRSQIASCRQSLPFLWFWSGRGGRGCWVNADPLIAGGDPPNLCGGCTQHNRGMSFFRLFTPSPLGETEVFFCVRCPTPPGVRLGTPKEKYPYSSRSASRYPRLGFGGHLRAVLIRTFLVYQFPIYKRRLENRVNTGFAVDCCTKVSREVHQSITG